MLGLDADAEVVYIPLYHRLNGFGIVSRRRNPIRIVGGVDILRRALRTTLTQKEGLGLRQSGG